MCPGGGGGGCTTLFWNGSSSSGYGNWFIFCLRTLCLFSISGLGGSTSTGGRGVRKQKINQLPYPAR